MSVSTSKHIQSADLTIFTESLGSLDDPAILLIMGAMNARVCWYDAFCQVLAEAVIKNFTDIGAD